MAKDSKKAKAASKEKASKTKKSDDKLKAGKKTREGVKAGKVAKAAKAAQAAEAAAEVEAAMAALKKATAKAEKLAAEAGGAKGGASEKAKVKKGGKKKAAQVVDASAKASAGKKKATKAKGAAAVEKAGSGKKRAEKPSAKNEAKKKAAKGKSGAKANAKPKVKAKKHAGASEDELENAEFYFDSVTSSSTNVAPHGTDADFEKVEAAIDFDLAEYDAEDDEDDGTPPAPDEIAFEENTAELDVDAVSAQLLAETEAADASAGASSIDAEQWHQITAELDTAEWHAVEELWGEDEPEEGMVGPDFDDVTAEFEPVQAEEDAAPELEADIFNFDEAASAAAAAPAPRREHPKKTLPLLEGVALYNLDESTEKGKLVRSILASLDITARTITKDQLGCSVGSIAGLPDTGLSTDPYEGEIPDCEFMLVCGIDTDALNELLQQMRAAKAQVKYKATITMYNKLWPVATLINEVSREHNAMNQASAM
jgi:hypothetical protein